VNISYIDPLRRAWARMVRMLFRPARARMWFVLGFAAFLAELGEGGGTIGFGRHWSRGNVPDWRGAWPAALFGFLGHPLWLALAGVGLILALILVIVVQWVSARGKLVFLDGVVHERAAIVEPWRRYAHIGNGLFVWWSVFGLVAGLLGLLATFPLWPWVTHMVVEQSLYPPPLGAALAVAALATPLVLAFLFVLVLLRDFVVPLMVRDGIGVTAAWARFRPLFDRHPGHFVAYAIFLIGVGIACVAAIFTIGFASCCVGWMVFAVPYFGTVALLPIHLTLRALGPEFLAQFGPEYSVFEAAPTGAGPGPATMAQAPPPPPPA
jgi:hypothetical protein